MLLSLQSIDLINQFADYFLHTFAQFLCFYRVINSIDFSNSTSTGTGTGTLLLLLLLPVLLLLLLLLLLVFCSLHLFFVVNILAVVDIFCICV